MSSFILGYCKCGCKKEIDIFDHWHYRLRRFIRGHNGRGLPHAGMKEDKNPNWKGGRIKHSNGYIQIRKPDHHFVDNRGYIFEHRYVWEQHIKASLLSWSIIHHKTHIKTDNRIENLEPFDSSEHSIHHLKERRDNEMTKRKCARCHRGTRERTRMTEKGFVYTTSGWNRNILERSQWICDVCNKTIRRRLRSKQIRHTVLDKIT